MPVYDILMLCLIAMTTLRGSTKGIAWQLAGIASLVLCFIFATPLSAAIAPMVPLNPPLNRWAAMLGAYLLFSFGCFSIARMFRGAMENAKFEAFDKHLGALFGFVKGVTICFVITFFAVCMSDAAADYILRTNSGYIAARTMQQIEPMLPVEVSSILRKAAGQQPMELDPLLAQQNQQEFGPDGQPIYDRNFQQAPALGTAPGAVPRFDQGYTEWDGESNDGAPSAGSAPRYQPIGPNPPLPGAPNSAPAVAPNGNAPLRRADFFRPNGAATTPQSAGGTAPAIADVLSKVPQVLDSKGTVAEKALGAFREWLPGNSPNTPAGAAPPVGQQPAPPNSIAGPGYAPASGANTRLPEEEDPFFSRQPDPRQNPSARSAAPPAMTLPGEDEVPIANNRRSPPSPIPNSNAQSLDEDFLPPRSGGPAVPEPPVRRRIEPNEFDPSENQNGAGSPPVPGSRIAPRPSGQFDDPIPSSGGARITPRTLPQPIADVDPRSNSIDEEVLLPSRRAPAPARVDPRAPAARSELISSPDEFGRRGSRVAPPAIHSTSVPNRVGGPSGIEIRPGENRANRDRTEEIQTLITSIATLLTAAGNRPALEADIQKSLTGVPQNIVASALRDWQADLLGDGTDKHPETDVTTPLETRLRLARERKAKRDALRSQGVPAGGTRPEFRTAPPPSKRF